MPRLETIILTAAAAALLTVAACGSDDEPTATEATPTTTESTSTIEAPETTGGGEVDVEELPAPPPTIASDPGAPTLWEHLNSVDDLALFRDAVVAADLVSRFEDCEEEVTVFGPKDWAIESIEETFGAGVLTAHLEAGEVDDLRSFVLDHMVAGAYDNDSFAGAGRADIELETLDGRPLLVIQRDPGSNRRVLQKDQFATQPLVGCNGTLHPTSWVVGY